MSLRDAATDEKVSGGAVSLGRGAERGRSGCAGAASPQKELDLGVPRHHPLSLPLGKHVRENLPNAGHPRLVP